MIKLHWFSLLDETIFNLKGIFNPNCIFLEGKSYYQKCVIILMKYDFLKIYKTL